MKVKVVNGSKLTKVEKSSAKSKPNLSIFQAKLITFTKFLYNKNSFSFLEKYLKCIFQSIYNTNLITNKSQNNYLDNTNDFELVLKSLHDANNFRYIIQKYEHKLYKYIQRILYVNKEDTEDILQEVFINVYKNLNSYSPDYKFSSWIYRIAHNECINFLRKNKNKLKEINTNINPKDDEMVYDLLDNIASDIDLENDFIKNYEKEMVHKILRELDEKYRAVLVLKYIEEKDYKEISDILKIPKGTVGSLINRAKKNFIKILKEKYEKRPV